MGNLLRRLLRWLNGRPDKVMYIGGSDTLPPPLPRQEEAEWIARLERGCTSPAGLRTPASTSRT